MNTTSNISKPDDSKVANINGKIGATPIKERYMNAKEQNQGQKPQEWPEEAIKNMMELLGILRKIDKGQAKMTLEEKRRDEWVTWDGNDMLFKY